MVGDVPHRVARDVEHDALGLADRDPVAFGYLQVQRGQAAGVGGGADHPGAGFLADARHAVDVVAVVMGDQDQVQAPAALLQRRQDRRGLGGVDQGGLPGRLVPGQVGVIVLKAGDCNNS